MSLKKNIETLRLTTALIGIAGTGIGSPASVMLHVVFDKSLPQHIPMCHGKLPAFLPAKLF